MMNIEYADRMLPASLKKYILSFPFAALGICLFLGLLAAVAVPVWKYGVREQDTLSLAWIGLYYLLISGGFFLLKRTPAEAESRVVIVLIVISIGIKGFLLSEFVALPLHGDQVLFHSFTQLMADHHLSSEAMTTLSQIYDYPVWATRALPFHLLFRWLAGPQDVFLVRWVNIVLSTGILLMVYGWACFLLPKGHRKWAVFLMAGFPFQSTVTIDYSHHLFSSLYFLSFLFSAWLLIHAKPTLASRVFHVLWMSLCLFLMTLQRGVHLIALGTIVGAIVLGVLWDGEGRHFWKSVLCCLILPWMLSLPGSSLVDQWISSHDARQYNSIISGFLARGWSPESGGEYCGRYEQLDRVTPWPEKKAAMHRLVLSQVRYNPVEVCVNLPIIKTAKLFLVGYASGFEEGIRVSRPDASACFRGLRLAAAPFILSTSILGCIVLANKKRNIHKWLIVVLAPLATWGAYVFLGETSPRYSIFCQPFLCLLGARGISFLYLRSKMPEPLRFQEWIRLIKLSMAFVIVLLGLPGLVWGITTWLPADNFYIDLNEATMMGNDSNQVLDMPKTLKPFERVICGCPAGDEEGSAVRVRIPLRDEQRSRVSLYLLEASGHPESYSFMVGPPGNPIAQIPLRNVSWPSYVSIQLPDSLPDSAITITLHPDAPDSDPQRTCLRWGYLSVKGAD